VKADVLSSGDEALLVRAVLAIDDVALSHERAAAHLADESLVCIVVLEGEQIAGFLYGYVLRRFTKTSFFIYEVDVLEPFRRRGVGKAMFARLRDEQRTRGWDEMFVFTGQGNAAAMALYRSAGGVRPNDDDVMFDFY
jgi:ribosomal protein S18 acetylase RimI-like enzyme